MKLPAKFNLIPGVVLGAGLAVAAAVSHQFLQNDAREEVFRQARLMIEPEFRSWTPCIRVRLEPCRRQRTF